MSDATALFDAHQAGLVRYLTRAVGQRDAARDLAQDVFVRVMRSDTWPGTDTERKAWLFRIARNLVIDHGRRQTVRRVEVASSADHARAATQDTTLTVNEALTAIDPLDRDVFLMREVAGLSYAEIGAACELTPDAVRNRIHRARLALRAHLAPSIAERRARPLSAR